MAENAEKQGNFSWRYFHFIDTGGARINIVEHETDIFGLESKPYMTMIAKSSGTEPVRFKSEPNLVWEGDVAERSGRFDFVFENARFTGTVNKILRLEELNDIVLHQDSKGRKSYWTVDVPYGKVEGLLTTPEGERKIAGYIYQDRQWGIILIQEWVKNWTWAHLANENLFVVIFCINATNGQRSWHAISGQGQEISLTNDFQVTYLSKLTKTKNPDTKEFQAEIKIPGKLSAVFSLQPKDIMRSRMDERYPGFSATYIRWAVDATADQSTEPMQGVAEYMKIERL